MSKRVDRLARQLARLTGEARVRVKRMSKRKKLAILVLCWLTPGLPPPGPFG